MQALSHMQPAAFTAHSGTGAYAPGAAAWVARACGAFVLVEALKIFFIVSS